MPFEDGFQKSNFAIDYSFNELQGSLDTFKDQDDTFHKKSSSVIFTSKHHKKNPNRKIIREARCAHSSILSEIDYNIAQKENEKRLISEQLKQKSQLPYEEIHNLRLRLEEIHMSKARLKEIQSEIENLEESKTIVLNSLNSLNIIAAAFCKKSQKKRLNGNKTKKQ